MIVQGKVAIVTGGAKGIGRYVAHTFLHAGGKVAVVDSDETPVASNRQGVTLPQHRRDGH